MRNKQILLSLLLLLISIACMTGAALAPTASQVAPAVGESVSSALVGPEPKSVPTAEGERWRVCGSLNVRAQAGAWGGVVDTLHNEPVIVLEWREGWARIGKDRWVNGETLCEKTIPP